MFQICCKLAEHLYPHPSCRWHPSKFRHLHWDFLICPTGCHNQRGFFSQVLSLLLWRTSSTQMQISAWYHMFFKNSQRLLSLNRRFWIFISVNFPFFFSWCISFYLDFLYLSNFCSFSTFSFCTSCVKIILKYFILYYAIMNGIVSLISFRLLPIYRNINFFVYWSCILTPCYIVITASNFLFLLLFP